MSDSDETNPQHYRRLSPEPITVIEAWGLSFCLGNALKYISRAGHKPGEDRDRDLAKARWYLDREITGVAQDLVDDLFDELDEAIHDLDETKIDNDRLRITIQTLIRENGHVQELLAISRENNDELRDQRDQYRDLHAKQFVFADPEPAE